MIPITKGKITAGTKFCLYGSEGIGKSTFVSQIPGIVFIDTEGSTNNMDVSRYPAPSSWTMLMDEVDDAIVNAGRISALAIDTADWAEKMLTDSLLSEKQIKSIADIPYGGGWEMLKERFGKLLNKLSDLSAKGVHVGFTAHAMMRKFEQPDELGAYDRWEMKTSKKVAPLIKEWADILLFANYKTMVYTTDKEGKKHKASGNQRVMYATHHACWDAKNRHGLPDEMPFDFKQVAHIFAPLHSQAAAAPAPIPEAPKPATEPPAAPKVEAKAAPKAEPKPKERELTENLEPPKDLYKNVPKALADLMKQDDILPAEVKAAVAQKGYYPIDTPWDVYPDDFVQGVLIGAWDQVKYSVLINRDKTPF